jgi:hypothetical protein
MSDHPPHRDSLSMKLGPVRVVEILTWAPKDMKASDCLGCETVPFEQVKHLCSVKPLLRRPPGEVRR